VDHSVAVCWLVTNANREFYFYVFCYLNFALLFARSARLRPLIVRLYFQGQSVAATCDSHVIELAILWSNYISTLWEVKTWHHCN